VGLGEANGYETLEKSDHSGVAEILRDGRADVVVVGINQVPAHVLDKLIQSGVSNCDPAYCGKFFRSKIGGISHALAPEYPNDDGPCHSAP
jgi:hypothetical protein